MNASKDDDEEGPTGAANLADAAAKTAETMRQKEQQKESFVDAAKKGAFFLNRIANSGTATAWSATPAAPVAVVAATTKPAEELPSESSGNNRARASTRVKRLFDGKHINEPIKTKAIKLLYTGDAGMVYEVFKDNKSDPTGDATAGDVLSHILLD